MNFKIGLTLLAIACISAAEIRSGSRDLLFDQGLKVENDSLMTSFLSYQGCTGGPGPDIFVSSADACCAATNCCCGLRIGSERTFYFSKKSFDSTSFSVPFNIADTNLFILVDTVQSLSRCTNYPSVVEPSDIGNPSTEQLRRIAANFFIVKTAGGAFALVKVRQFLYPPGIPPIGFSRCINGIGISWYLQTNRTTDFRDIIPIQAGSPQVRTTAPSSIGTVKKVRTFTPLGEAFYAPKSGYSGVVIQQVVGENGMSSTRKIVVNKRKFNSEFEKFVDMWR